MDGFYFSYTSTKVLLIFASEGLFLHKFGRTKVTQIYPYSTVLGFPRHAWLCAPLPGITGPMQHRAMTKKEEGGKSTTYVHSTSRGPFLGPPPQRTRPRARWETRTTGINRRARPSDDGLKKMGNDRKFSSECVSCVSYSFRLSALWRRSCMHCRGGPWPKSPEAHYAFLGVSKTWKEARTESSRGGILLEVSPKIVETVSLKY